MRAAAGSHLIWDSYLVPLHLLGLSASEIDGEVGEARLLR